MKIRLGNDINLKVQLTFKNIDGSDVNESRVNIQSMKAVFINTTLKEKLEKELKNKRRFFGRFPIEPFLDEFIPTEYNINSTGYYPKYRAFVFNQYKGFGWNPDWKNSLPIKDVNITEYQAEVTRTADIDTVVISFPAEAQLYAGEYELVVYAQILAPGYKHDVRTICTNYNNVFELVEDSLDADFEDAVNIEISNASSDEERQDVYVVAGHYDDNSIVLNRNDRGVISVDVSPISGWYENID